MLAQAGALGRDEDEHGETDLAELMDLVRQYVELRTSWGGCDECHQGESGHADRCWVGRFGQALGRIERSRD